MLNKLYYTLKPLIPRRFQLQLRRYLVASRLDKYRDVWPIDPKSAAKPDWFTGWPDSKKFALVVTHDVEKAGGLEKVKQLLAIDKQYGIRSSFGLVPELYDIDPAIIDFLKQSGCEVYVHDLNHDGKLFSSYRTFHKRAQRINEYVASWNVKGFRAGAMHHNLDWIGELNIDYDMSTFDTDPFEPMPDGVGTIFPFVANSPSTGRTYVEIPYTLPQDLMTMIIHPARSIALWLKKVEWIAANGGMVLVNVHPDYIAFDKGAGAPDTYPAGEYGKFLADIKSRYGDDFWNPLPSEMCGFVNKNGVWSLT